MAAIGKVSRELSHPTTRDYICVSLVLESVKRQMSFRCYGIRPQVMVTTENSGEDNILW